MSDWIVIIGGRSAAVDAALALNLNVLLVAEPKTPARLFARCALSLSVNLRTPIEQLLPSILNVLDNIQPAAVIAVTEQGVLPAAYVREHFKLSGQSVESARASLIKSSMKQRFISANLPCWPTVAIESVDQAVEQSKEFSFPVIVKALASSGSRGLRVVKDRSALRRVTKSMLQREEYGGVGLEPFCEARECSVELILQQGRVLFSNITDYLVASCVNLLPARFPPEMTQRLLDLSQQIVEIFSFTSGMVHIEFYYTDTDIWIGEINARPPGGGLMDLIERAYKIDPWQLVIKAQLNEPLEPVNTTRCRHAANWIIHPGKGEITEINGVDSLASHPLTANFKLKLKVGQKVMRREGTGESVGTLTMVHANYKKLKDAILNSRTELDIKKVPI